MKKTSFTPIFSIWSWFITCALVLTLNVQADAQCTLSCNNLVQISLDEDCQVAVNPDMILEGNGCPNGNLVVQMKINGAWVPAIVNQNHINQTIEVRVRDLNSGNTCWGYMHIEDKLAPVLVCTDIQLSCVIDDYDPQYLSSTLGIAAAYPTVSDNCQTPTLTFTDTWFDLPCGGSFNGVTDLSGYVRRIWVAMDPSGNQSTCTQFLYFKRRHIPDVFFPADVTVSCSNPNTEPSATGAPFLKEFNKNFPLYPNVGFCELNVVYSDQILPVCDGTYKILRTWTVYDWCVATTPFPPNQNPFTHIQLIKVEDAAGPVLDCPADLTASTNPNDCESDFDLPDFIIEDNCSQIASIEAQWTVYGKGYSLFGTVTNFPGNNLWDRDTLGVFGYANNLPLGTTTVTYIVTDDCGNTSTCSFKVTIEDQTPPIANCIEFTKVALGSNGMALVPASSFNAASYDNCSPVTFKARRMDANSCQTNNQFHDDVKFCCSDIGDTITIVFRVYDVPMPAGSVGLQTNEDDANDCMVQILVEDKLKPVITCPANVTVNCENFDPSFWAHGKPTISDNCCIKDTVVTVSYTNFDTVCNKGTITRTFRAVDCYNNTATCTQRITVTYSQDYYVQFPNDVIVTFCDSSGVYGQPTFFDKDCELLAVSFEDEVFTVVPDACFKIERTWHVINWCAYNPNLPLTYVPNPEPNATVNNPANLPGPRVSACGTPAPWNPTVVALTPGTTPVNYCTYYTPNGNGYEYKQIIKIVDTQDPVVANCPASPVEFCDLTVNNLELWNEMYWWDNIIGSHDLCEGPTDLNITATDFCSGNNININYLLFLDLDADGTMETVINSKQQQTSNQVLYNNANTPNYTGGTARAFDQRPVPFNQKYRFALQTTTSGKNRTAAVRWNTVQSPTNFVVPELPYGTHKIKWFVEDGCGNETVCEYTFIVKDCKKPTIICYNGLAVNIMPTGMITVWASDFLKEKLDNCTPADQIKIGIRKSGAGTGFPVDGAGNPITSVTFNCQELGTQLVELWGIDKAGNADFCETYLLVQDNMGNCGTSQAVVAGTLIANNATGSTGLQNASISLVETSSNGGLPNSSIFGITDINGKFHLNALPLSGSGAVVPEKDDDPLNGVTTYDLVLIQRHILGIELLDSPYKMIAADANKSGSVTSFDIVELRKLILGVYQNGLPANTSWRFVEKAYQFTSPANPFKDKWPETIMINQLPNLSADFQSIKVGDVNNSASPNENSNVNERNNGQLELEVEDRLLTAGEEVLVPFFVTAKNAGYQFTLNTENVEVLEVIPAAGLSTDNFGLFEKALTVSAEGEGQAFTLRLRARNNGRISNLLHVTDQITRSVAYTTAGEAQAVTLRFKQNGQVAQPGFELLQNQPNPAKDYTTIAFYLPDAAEGSLTITNAEGRLVKRISGSFAKGFNQIVLQRSDLEAGVLFYQLDTPTHSATRKMIITE